MITKASQLQTVKQTSTMYHMVFGSRFAQLGAFSLLAFLLIQPIAPVFASELVSEEVPTTVIETVEEPETNTSVVDPINEEIETVEESQEEIQEPTEVQTGSASEEVIETVQDDVQDTEVSVPVTQEVPSPASSTDEELPTEDEVTESEEEQTDVDLDTSPEDGAVDPVIEEETEHIEVPHNSDVQEEDEDPASTTPEDENQEVVQEVVHNTSAYQFDTKECTSVGDGAYYCSEAVTESTFTEDGVFSAPDADGDLEIFVRVGGQETQITSNKRDDSAPYFDPLSERIVWHSLIHDRYQIVSFDIETGEETVLTDTSYNNMEPVAHGKATVWQAWVHGNWEIMLLQGGEVVQLTDNAMHDVSPHMREDHVVWQTQYAEGWQISVYDIRTGQLTSLPSEDGSKIENPRFVLVYDTTNEAGDIQTMGYDPDENRSFLLNSIPVELPEELPNPDQTGETRALIQNKSSVKGLEIEEAEPTPTPTASSSNPHASSTDSLPTLDMRTSTGTLMSASTTIAMSDIEDLVIASTTPITEETPIDYGIDLVIPPSASTTAE